MEPNTKLTPTKLWILTLVTITVITLLVFTGIKLFGKSSASINKNSSTYTFESDVCSVSFNPKSEQFTTSDKCWEPARNKAAWFMICNSPKVGDLGRAVEVRVFFFQGKYAYTYAFDLWHKKMDYKLKDFTKDIEDGRIKECMYQYPMNLPSK
ncbi:hypothetical protein [Fibrobacter sp. UWB5]|uniref:hypothetical protein n=1 Tax=Fibrobacter sp. UWB5 TaxID=1964360 RepID=UPI000B523A16|nr:hypothetical protein [Fibrobacter sp. UWB5]OWV13271.1 hypothetical protein B7989_05135 [Fibrobacter sp. UWB5]